MSYLPHVSHVLPASDPARASAKTRGKPGQAHEAKQTGEGDEGESGGSGGGSGRQEAPPREPRQGKRAAAVGGVGVGGGGKVARGGGDGGDGGEGRPNICPTVCHGEGGAQSFLSLTSSLSLAGFAGKFARAITYARHYLLYPQEYALIYVKRA